MFLQVNLVGIVVLALSGLSHLAVTCIRGRTPYPRVPMMPIWPWCLTGWGQNALSAELNNCPSSINDERGGWEKRKQGENLTPFQVVELYWDTKRRAYVNMSSCPAVTSHLEVQGCNILPSNQKPPFQWRASDADDRKPPAPKGTEGTKVSSSLKEECLQLCISSCDQPWSLGVKSSRSPLGNEVC